MRTFFKIILLIAAVFPIWLTIAAMGETATGSDAWKSAINSKLLEQATDSRRMQVEEMLPSSDRFEEAYLTEKFELVLPTQVKGRGAVIAELRFIDAEGRLTRILKAPLKLFVEEKVRVATRDLPRGTLVEERDVRDQWVNAATLRDRCLSPVEIIGRKTKSNLSAGAVFYPNTVEKEVMVQTGDRVRVVILGNQISVSGVGIAKEAGNKGQTIRILNPDSRKEIYGTIVDERKVEVRL